MGDQAKYRDAVHNLFFEGMEPGEIEVEGPDGEVRRLKGSQPAEPVDLSKPIPSHAMEALKDLRAQIAARQEDVDYPDST